MLFAAIVAVCLAAYPFNRDLGPRVHDPSTIIKLRKPGGRMYSVATNKQIEAPYLYYDGNDYGQATLGLRELDWDKDGWPVAGAYADGK